jgi:soluble lytic murein transglycosylase
LTKEKTTVQKITKIVITTAIILIATIILRNIILKINYPQKYSEYVEKYAKEFEIEKELIYAMIKAESNFKYDAVSSKGALGLMQILESTAYEVAGKIELEITKEEIINPETNICLGTKYISNLIQRYGNIELAVASYNAGIGNVDNWIEEEIIEEDGTDIENIPFKETNNYVRKILRGYKIYKQLYN